MTCPYRSQSWYCTISKNPFTGESNDCPGTDHCLLNDEDKERHFLNFKERPRPVPGEHGYDEEELIRKGFGDH
jgi:hypothetical protein